jgi:hypothetical protein
MQAECRGSRCFLGILFRFWTFSRLNSPVNQAGTGLRKRGGDIPNVRV